MDPCHENILPKLFNKTPQASVLGFQGDIVVKNPPANAGDARNKDSISRLGRFLEKEIAVHSSILVWKIPWAEERGALQSIGLKRVRHD